MNDKDAEIARLRAEINRLTEAKRRALAIADERTKENAELRAKLQQREMRDPADLV